MPFNLTPLRNNSSATLLSLSTILARTGGSTGSGPSSGGTAGLDSFILNTNTLG